MSAPTPTESPHAQAMLLVLAAARLLAHLDLDERLRDIARADSIAQIVAPTLYRNRSREMHEDKEILEAALPLWRLARKLLAEEPRPLSAPTSSDSPKAVEESVFGGSEPTELDRLRIFAERIRSAMGARDNADAHARVLSLSEQRDALDEALRDCLEYLEKGPETVRVASRFARSRARAALAGVQP